MRRFCVEYNIVIKAFARLLTSVSKDNHHFQTTIIIRHGEGILELCGATKSPYDKRIALFV